MPPMRPIGQQLEQERLRRGQSQEEAAEALKVSQATFSRWVQGSVPKSQHWTRIARYLSLPRDQVAEAVNLSRRSPEARLEAIERELAELRREVRNALEEIGRRR